MSVWTGRTRAAGPCTVALLLVLALSGCGGSDNGDETPTSATPTATTPAERPLPAAWYEDPDGDFVPTAVEREIDTDPDVDECAKEAGCGSSAVNALEHTNTLLMLDSSGSMATSAGGGTTKMAAAKSALRRYVAGTPDSVALGFLVFGHKGSNSASGKAKSCAGVDLLQPIETAAFQRFDDTLERFHPVGFTPLGAALREARDAFEGKEGDVNKIILVTDGVDTCGGDPVAEARKLKQAGIDVTTDVVGFDVAKPEEAQRLRDIAEASGGTYSDARTADALADYFEQARDRYSELAKEYLCVLSHSAKVSNCMLSTYSRGVNQMFAAEADASKAGRADEAAEIARLREDLKAAGDKRDEEFKSRSEADATRLKRELDEAERRYVALGK